MQDNNHNHHPIPLTHQHLYGPIVVSSQEEGEKIYSFLHKHFPSISKRSLRKYFQWGCVSINGIPLQPQHLAPKGEEGGERQQQGGNHDIESRKVICGESITILEEWQQIILTSIENESLHILQEVELYAIVEKIVGIETNENSMFHYVCRQRLWSSRFYETLVFLYEIEFAISGIMICFPSKEERSKWLMDRVSPCPALLLDFTCLVCGKVSVPCSSSASPSVSSSVIIPVEQTSSLSDDQLAWEEYRSLFQVVEDLQVISAETAPCRSKEHLTLLTIQLSFRLPTSSTMNDTIRNEHCINKDIDRLCQQYSHDLKQIKRLFKRLHRPIVGHDDHLIKNKGLYFVQNKLSFSRSSNLLESYLIEIPNKLRKALYKERDLFYQQEQIQLNLREKLLKETTTDHNQDLSGASSSCKGVDNSNDMPLEYQIGKAYFYNLMFTIAPPPGIVMIPRKSSETLVTTTLRYVKEYTTTNNNIKSVHVVDMGTGSGCLLLSILHNLVMDATRNQSGIREDDVPLISGVGIDLSEDALTIAQNNANSLNLNPYCHFQQGSFADVSVWLQALNLSWDALNVIVCNPPYSASMESNRLSKRVKRYEPKLALYADKKDSLKAYRDIAKELQELSHVDVYRERMPRIIFMIELGQGQEVEVRKIFEAQLKTKEDIEDCNQLFRWRIGETVSDHKGMQRCLVISNVPSSEFS